MKFPDGSFEVILKLSVSAKLLGFYKPAISSFNNDVDLTPGTKSYSKMPVISIIPDVTSIFLIVGFYGDPLVPIANVELVSSYYTESIVICLGKFITRIVPAGYLC